MKRALKLVIISSLVLPFGCKEKTPAPVAPEISYLDAYLSEDRSHCVVKFSFFDGDGDIGLKQEENSGENASNLLIDYYEKINGVWELKSPLVTWNSSENRFDTTELHLRIPFIQNESGLSLEGETTVDILYNFSADTIKYELTLKDRAFHLSNKIETAAIVLN